MIAAFLILVPIINIVMAWWHSVLIKQNKPIYHGLWTAIYLIIVGSISILVSDVSAQIVPLVLYCIVVRKPFFDISLNLFRGKEWYHVSETTTSFWDDIILSLLHNKEDIKRWYAGMIAVAIVLIVLIYFIR